MQNASCENGVPVNFLGTENKNDDAKHVFFFAKGLKSDQWLTIPPPSSEHVKTEEKYLYFFYKINCFLSFNRVINQFYRIKLDTYCMLRVFTSLHSSYPSVWSAIALNESYLTVSSSYMSNACIRKLVMKPHVMTFVQSHHASTIGMNLYTSIRIQYVHNIHSSHLSN